MPVLMDIGAGPMIAAATELSSSTIYRVLDGRQPHAKNRARYQAVALQHARERLKTWNTENPETDAATAVVYLRERHERGEDTRRCQHCGQPLPEGTRSDTRFGSAKCRQAAARAKLAGCELVD